MKLFLHKLQNWEYWPYPLVFLPVFLVWPYFALKARAWFFFNAVNPSMKNGGFIMNSKKEIYDLIPEIYYPDTLLINPETAAERVLDELKKYHISYPLFVKPDIGLRGMAVVKIYNETMLRAYHAEAKFGYLIQETSPYANEAGIFYIRIPGEEKGRITGIVSKEFLKVVGDGRTTIEELLKTNKRFALQLEPLRKEYGEVLHTVLEPEQEWEVPYGNHCRGAKFLDARNKITAQLNETMHKVALQIDGYYYGRMDILFDTWEALENGERFHIVELNGAVSEPTHMYDPDHSIWFAWKEILLHYNTMSTIARANNSRGIEHTGLFAGIRELKSHFQYISQVGSN